VCVRVCAVYSNGRFYSCHKLRKKLIRRTTVISSWQSWAVNRTPTSKNLKSFLNNKSDNLTSFCHSGSFVRSFVDSILRTFVRSFVYSFVRSFVRSLVFSTWFVRSFLRWFDPSFVRLSILCSLTLFSHSFVSLFVCFVLARMRNKIDEMWTQIVSSTHKLALFVSIYSPKCPYFEFFPFFLTIYFAQFLRGLLFLFLQNAF